MITQIADCRKVCHLPVLILLLCAALSPACSLLPGVKSVGNSPASDNQSWPQATAGKPVIKQPPLVAEIQGGSQAVSAAPAAPAAAITYKLNAVQARIDSLLFALCRDADLQLAIQGKADVLVTLIAEDDTLESLLDKLARQASFYWSVTGNQLHVWFDKVFTRVYSINYLNLDRQTHSSVGLATQVGTINVADGGTGSINNSSDARINNSSEHRFWQSLKQDIEKLLQAESGRQLHYSINRDAGLLSVHGSPDIHRVLDDYLRKLHDNASRQVLIEATVVEVALTDRFESGVDWQVLANGVSGISAAQLLPGVPIVDNQSINRLAAPAGIVNIVRQGSQGSIRATLSLLEQFGDVRILSRPRIIALNNQSAVLKVVDNRVYFTVTVERRQSDQKDELITESEIHTVPVGLVMNVTPHISDDGVVMMNIRPSLSRILGFVDDPNPELALAQVRNGVPEIQIREMESMLRIPSGQLAIIGGLMQETKSANRSRIPGLGRIPILGHLFAQQQREGRRTELLIVLRPTLVSATVNATANANATATATVNANSNSNSNSNANSPSLAPLSSLVAPVSVQQ